MRRNAAEILIEQSIRGLEDRIDMELDDIRVKESHIEKSQERIEGWRRNIEELQIARHVLEREAK